MEDIDASLSFMLFQRPSFFEGMARIFDFGGALNVYDKSASGEEADVRALAADWLMVGNDIHKAMKNVR